MLKVIGGVPDGEYKAVASGTLPNGKPVIVNSDGTVSVVAETSVSENKGTEVVFDSSYVQDITAVYDETSNKLVVVYHDTDASNQATYAVGTVSGSSISFGTPAVVESGIQYNNKQLVYHAASGKVVLVYRDTSQSGRGEARVGTVSGTSISWGTAAVFESGASGVTNLAAAYDASTEKVLIIYRDDTTSNYGTAIVATVSGTSISFGTKVVFLSATVGATGVTYDASAQKMVVCYHDGGNSYYGTSIVGTISGTSVSFGSPVVFYSGGTADNIAVAYDANSQKNLFVYRISAGTQGVGIVGTVSGTSISFGSQSSAFISVDHDAQYYLSYHAVAKKVVVAFRGASNYPYITVGTISGTSVTFTTPTPIQSANGENTPITYDPDTGQSLIAFRDAANSNYGTALTYIPAYDETNLTSENYIGMSRGVTDVLATSAGTPVVYEAATVFTYTQGITYDSNANKTVISYVDGGNGNYGTAIVGTVSGTSISFGSPTVFETGVTGKPASVFDSTNNKIIICYDDGGNSDYLTAVVGTVSGTSISFGTPVVAHAAAVDFNAITYDTNSQRVVIAYKNRSGSDYGTAVVGTVSGTSISFGTPVVFSSANTAHISATFDSTNNKVVFSFRNAGNGYGQSIVGTVSGTSISFGSVVNITTSSSQSFASTFDTNAGKVVIAYDDAGAGQGAVVVGTVSGTSISFGTAGTFSSSQPSSVSISYDSVNQKVAIPYIDGTTLTGIVATGSVSGTDITIDSGTATFESGTSSGIGSTYDSSAGKVVTSYKDTGNSNYGTSAVITVGYENRYPVADGNPASIDVIGSVSTNQSGLTAGEKYYVQTDGTISTTAGDPSVLAGTAISATKLVVKT